MLTLALAAILVQSPYAGWTVHHLVGIKGKPVNLCLPGKYKITSGVQSYSNPPTTDVDYDFEAQAKTLFVTISPGPNQKEAAEIANNVLRKPPPGSHPIGSTPGVPRPTILINMFDHDYWVWIGTQSGRNIGTSLSCQITPLKPGRQALSIFMIRPGGASEVTFMRLAASWFVTHNPVKP